MPELRAFGAADRYLQGPDALDRIGEHAASLGLGAQALVLIDAFMLPQLEQRLATSFSDAGIAATTVPVSAEVTPAVMAGFAQDAAARTSFVVGVGGGKTIDIAKGVAARLGLRVITAPTIASNDSPASRAIAVYDEQHQLAEVPLMPHNPALVVVDTAVIAGAPARFLAAGIGDALSKHAEVEACRAAGGITMQGTRGLRVASILAEGCYRLLRENAPAAVAALEAGTLAPGGPAWAAFEDTVEAVILLSGMAFENGGLSIAHALTRGLMAAPGASSRLHGEHVAYGLLVQRALGGAPDEELDDLAAFLGSIGLPATLAELGGTPSEAVWQAIAERTLTAPHTANFDTPVTAATLTAAFTRVESLPRS